MSKLSEMNLSEMEIGLQYALEYLQATMSFKFAMDNIGNTQDIIDAANNLYTDIENIEAKSENTPS